MTRKDIKQTLAQESDLLEATLVVRAAAIAALEASDKLLAAVDDLAGLFSVTIDDMQTRQSESDSLE
jgi:hypothetical protein